jgi:hypothetical protein
MSSKFWNRNDQGWNGKKMSFWNETDDQLD